MRGDLAPGYPSPSPTSSSPGRQWRARTHGGNSQGPTFSRSFINQNGPCHKKQGPSPQKYDFAKRKSCWLRGCMWWKIFVWFFFPPSFFLQFFFISLRCNFFFFFFVTVGFCRRFFFFFLIKHLRSRTQTQYKQKPPIPTPGAPAGLGTLGTPLGFLCGCFPCPFPGV